MTVISRSSCAPSSLWRPSHVALFKVPVRTWSEKSRCGRSSWLTSASCTDRQPRTGHPDRQARPYVSFAIRSFQQGEGGSTSLVDAPGGDARVTLWSRLDLLQARNRRDRQSVVHRSDSRTFRRYDGLSGVYRRGRFTLYGFPTVTLSARNSRQPSRLFFASHRRTAGTDGGTPDLASSGANTARFGDLDLHAKQQHRSAPSSA